MPLNAPKLDCPFQAPCHENPHVAAVHEASLHWAKSYGFLSDKQTYDFYDGSEIAWGMGQTHPHAGPEMLQLVTDFWTHYCLLDDAVENTRDLAEVRDWSTRYLAMLQGGPLPTQGHPLVLAAADLCMRFRRQADPVWMSHFAQSVRFASEGFAWELLHRTTGLPVRFSDYERVGEWVTGGHFMVDLCMLVDGIQLRPESVQRARSLRRLAARLFFIENSMVGVARERHANNPFNYLLQSGLPLELAMDRAAQTHDRWMQQLARHADELSADPHADPALTRFVLGLGRGLRAHLDWARISTRAEGWHRTETVSGAFRRVAIADAV